MTTFKLPTSAEKATYVHDQFERIARRYDLTNDAISLGMHRLWKRAAIQSLNLRPDGSYLDVCCGTGDLALAIAQRLGEKGKVTGLDFSANMLKIAENRRISAHSDCLPRCIIEWCQGDAHQLPFTAGTFDGAIISFGLRNLIDLPAGIQQMRKVVKPGGRVVNLDLGHPRLPLFTPAFDIYFRHLVPIIGGILQNDRQAYTYLPESRNTYPKPDALTEMFRQAGLSDVRFIPLALGSVALHVGTVA